MDKYTDLILSALSEICNDIEHISMAEVDTKTKLFGANGILDSMGIVFLVSELEDLINEEFGIYITLADEKAMSQATSPFRNVESLATYMKSLVEEVQR